MAVRLNVIMVQTPPAGVGAQHLSEAIVGEVIGRPGIDMILVGRLDQIAADSTDRLTLDSIAGDAAVLDWQSPEEIMSSLAQVGFESARAPHPHDQDAPASSDPKSRRVYAFDLRQFGDASQISSSLQSLLASRQVRTFTLGQSGSPKPPISQSTSTATPPPTSRPVSSESSNKAVPQESRKATLDLDQLIDDLDDLDP